MFIKISGGKYIRIQNCKYKELVVKILALVNLTRIFFLVVMSLKELGSISGDTKGRKPLYFEKLSNKINVFDMLM